MSERNGATKGKNVAKHTKSGKRMTKKEQQKRKMMTLGIEIGCLALLLIVLFVWSFVGKINFSDFGEDEAGINSDLSQESLEILDGYTNIALFGLDNRSGGNYNGGQSDVIMVASINNKTKEVKLISVYRDTFLNVGDNTYKKANSAYAKGGPERAVQMLNSNLDLNIKEYVCVDFIAVMEVIDALGGIEIDITQQEAELVNSYLWELEDMLGKERGEEKLVQGHGVQTLTGAQALSYSRIRSTAGDDFKRTSRQRIVLGAMLDKAKKSDIGTLMNICEVVFDDIKTSISLTEIMDLAKDVRAYSIGSTSGFPFAMTTTKISGSGDSVVPVHLENNVTQLYAYFFETEGYVPSDSVKEYSAQIKSISGVSDDASLINTGGFNDTAGQDGTVFH